jgi:hypothetical protein
MPAGAPVGKDGQVNTGTSSVTVCRCDCHEWHRVVDIGDWMVRRGGGDLIPARTWARTGGVWRPGHCELTHEDLTARIQAAGGIACGYALEALTLLSGKVQLANGLHRWVVADELGIGMVPVEMRTETEPVWGWQSGMLS